MKTYPIASAVSARVVFVLPETHGQCTSIGPRLAVDRNYSRFSYRRGKEESKSILGQKYSVDLKAESRSCDFLSDLTYSVAVMHKPYRGLVRELRMLG